eukprot:scaffold2640_cov180-Amphora_coffeaeformis.AAC.12
MVRRDFLVECRPSEGLHNLLGNNRGVFKGARRCGSLIFDEYTRYNGGSSGGGGSWLAELSR